MKFLPGFIKLKLLQRDYVHISRNHLEAIYRTPLMSFKMAIKPTEWLLDRGFGCRNEIVTYSYLWEDLLPMLLIRKEEV